MVGIRNGNMIENKLFPHNPNNYFNLAHLGNESNAYYKKSKQFAKHFRQDLELEENATCDDPFQPGKV